LYGWPHVLRILKAKKLITLNIYQTKNNFVIINHVIDWDHAKVSDRESNRMDQRGIREEMHIRKQRDRSME